MIGQLDPQRRSSDVIADRKRPRRFGGRDRADSAFLVCKVSLSRA
jgi:hypothetical protein